MKRGEKKVFFIIFKGLSIAKNCLKPEGAPSNNPWITKGILKSCKTQ